MLQIDRQYSLYNQRGPQDATPRDYHARLSACLHCPTRHGHLCRADNQLCSIMARPVAAQCPHGLWPGESPRPGTPVWTPYLDAERLKEQPPRPLRVGLLTSVLTTGGVERWWLSLCKQWTQGNAIEPAGIAITPPGGTTTRCLRDALRFGPIYAAEWQKIPGTTKLPTAELAAAELLKNCDVVITWSNSDQQRYIRGFAGNVVLVAHGEGPWTQKIMAEAAPSATHLVSVADAAVRAYPERFRSRVNVIDNGIELDRCAPTRSRDDVRAEWGIEPDVWAVGYIGRSSEEKNPTATARGVAALNAAGQKAVAIYVHPHFVEPDGKHRDKILAALDTAAGGDPAVRFLASPPTHLGDVFAGLDCLVMASDQEGCSLAVMEAVSAKVPVAATAVGCVPQQEQRYGPIFAILPHRPTGEQIASGIRRAIEAADFGSASRGQDAVRQHYTAARMGADWEKYLTSFQ